MQAFLTQRNQELLNNVEVLIGSIRLAQVPPELEPYKEHILQSCKWLHDKINLQISYLELGREDILNDILSNTNQITERVRLVSSRLAVPILRASLTDRLSLHVIGWLHQEHPTTSQYPPAFSSGTYAVYPFRFAPVYLIPTVEQSGLLYQPLLFHEFGHLLYECHRPEMDDLVTDLRQDLVDLLRPVSQKNDRFAEQQANKRQVIADTWYTWTQELFCDAVGFEIGGPCFLHSFSSFLSSLNETDFRRQPNDLWMSTHPVSWLRVRFLVERANSRGLSKLADTIWNGWCMTAEAMELTEDYYGFYHDSLSQPVIETLEDMLEEVAPRKYTELELNGDHWRPTTNSPVRLLNWAWQIRNESPATYATWEAEQLEYFFEACDHRNSTRESQLRRFFHNVLGHIRSTEDLQAGS